MAKLGSKILQNIDGMRKDFLYGICVYIHKVYNALEWGCFLEILKGYGVGPISSNS